MKLFVVVGIIAGLAAAAIAVEPNPRHMLLPVNTVVTTHPSMFWGKTEGLLLQCVSSSDIELAYCSGYIAGLDDAASFLVEDPLHCAGKEKLIRDYRTAFVNFVLTHPDTIDDPASVTVMRALRASFPCVDPPPPQPNVKTTHGESL